MKYVPIRPCSKCMLSVILSGCKAHQPLRQSAFCPRNGSSFSNLDPVRFRSFCYKSSATVQFLNYFRPSRIYAKIECNWFTTTWSNWHSITAEIEQWVKQHKSNQIQLNYWTLSHTLAQNNPGVVYTFSVIIPGSTAVGDQFFHY